MAAVGVLRRQVQVRHALPAASVSLHVEIVVAAGGIQGDEVGLGAERAQREVVLREVETGLEQFAAAEVMLVLDGADINKFDIGRSCGYGLERRKTRVLVMNKVEK